MDYQALEQGRLYVANELQRGVNLNDVRNQLIQSGWSSQDADSVIQQVQHGDAKRQDPSTSPEQTFSTSTYASRTGQGMLADQTSNSKNWSVKAVLLLVSGTLCFVIFFGMLLGFFFGGIKGGGVRAMVWLIFGGGALLKNGFDALNKKK